LECELEINIPQGLKPEFIFAALAEPFDAVLSKISVPKNNRRSFDSLRFATVAGDDRVVVLEDDFHPLGCTQGP
jgi:hypothetical protein